MKDIDALDLDKLLHDNLDEKDLNSMLNLISQVSWWVNPDVYHSVPVVYPKTRRKKGKELRGEIINGIRLWLNEPAKDAFWFALGKKPKEIMNFYICHIYENSVGDPEHFTNLANITAFPKSLQSLSEWKPVSDLLKYQSYKLYGYTGPENKIPTTPKYYPESWQYVSEPSHSEKERIKEKLRQQCTKRPTCNSKDNHLRH